MISEEVLKSMTKDQITEEIKSRRELLSKMIGSLYPSIIRDEIYQLNLQYRSAPNRPPI